MSKEEKIVGQCKSSVSKELEALENLYCSGNLQLDYVLSNQYKQDYEIIKQALTTKSKKEQAFEIIKEKQVFVKRLKALIREYGDKALEDYNVSRAHKEEELNQEEFDLLKEVL